MRHGRQARTFFDPPVAIRGLLNPLRSHVPMQRSGWAFKDQKIGGPLEAVILVFSAYIASYPWLAIVCDRGASIG